MSPTVQAVEVVQSAYAAFGRGDTPALLSLIADDVEWKFIGAKGLPYTGTFRTRDEVANWFAGIPEVDDVLAFEPREFMHAGDNVTVLGWERTQTRPSGISRPNGPTSSRCAAVVSYGSGESTTPKLPPLREAKRRPAGFPRRQRK